MNRPTTERELDDLKRDFRWFVLINHEHIPLALAQGTGIDPIDDIAWGLTVMDRWLEDKSYDFICREFPDYLEEKRLEEQRKVATNCDD